MKLFLFGKIIIKKHDMFISIFPFRAFSLMFIFMTMMLNTALSQGKYDYGALEESFEIDNYTTIEYMAYDTTKSKFYKINNEIEVDFSKPEGLVLSKIYANNKDWAKRNNEDSLVRDRRDDSHYEAIKKMDKNKEFIRFLCKYTYTQGGEEICIISFAIHTELTKNEIPMTIQCIKKKNRWYEGYRTGSFAVLQIIDNFRWDVLEKIFIGKPTENERFNALLMKIGKNELIDMKILFKEYTSWKQLKSKDDKENLHYFTFNF